LFAHVLFVPHKVIEELITTVVAKTELDKARILINEIKKKFFINSPLHK
jgi:hypothetical protein